VVSEPSIHVGQYLACHLLFSAREKMIQATFGQTRSGGDGAHRSALVAKLPEDLGYEGDYITFLKDGARHRILPSL
jgi:hypothetical protein